MKMYLLASIALGFPWLVVMMAWCLDEYVRVLEDDPDPTYEDFVVVIEANVEQVVEAFRRAGVAAEELAARFRGMAVDLDHDEA